MANHRCPSCGFDNPTGAVECAQCGFPLEDHGGPAASAPAPSATPRPGSTPARPAAPARPLPRPLRRPPRRPRRSDATSTTLWIVFGGFAAMVVLWVALQSTLKRDSPPQVPGSTPGLQAVADSLAHVLGHDSTNVDARQRMADLYYDTGNWDEAIRQYRIVLRYDSTRTTAMVDMGVCYFNLGDKPTAEALFTNALVRDPKHPVALFNLGIVYESREDYRTALSYFHRCLESGPPDHMQPPIIQSIQRLQEKMGIKPPPLEPGAGSGRPPGMPPGATPPGGR